MKRFFLPLLLMLIMMTSEDVMAQNNSMGPIINNSGIVTHGQVGNNYIIQNSVPTVSVVGELPLVKNADGTFTKRLILKLEAQSPPNGLVVAVKKDDIIYKDTVPMPTGFSFMPRFGGVTMGSSGYDQNSGYVWSLIQAPRAGEYTVSTVVLSETAQPHLAIQVQ